MWHVLYLHVLWILGKLLIHHFNKWLSHLICLGCYKELNSVDGNYYMHYMLFPTSQMLEDAFVLSFYQTICQKSILLCIDSYVN